MHYAIYLCDMIKDCMTKLLPDSLTVVLNANIDVAWSCTFKEFWCHGPFPSYPQKIDTCSCVCEWKTQIFCSTARDQNSAFNLEEHLANHYLKAKIFC